MPQITVRLTWHEVVLAAQVGMRRHVEALRDARPDANGRSDDDGWTAHVEGACGELAVAKVLDVYWQPSVNTFKRGGDVGLYQVRTRSRATYELIVREDDDDDATFILVRGRSPQFSVVGWIRGADAKRLDWLQTHGDRPAAYFVPDAALSPMGLLRPEARVEARFAQAGR